MNRLRAIKPRRRNAPTDAWRCSIILRDAQQMLYGFLAQILTKRYARLDPDDDALNINKDAADLSGLLEEPA